MYVTEAQLHTPDDKKIVSRIFWSHARWGVNHLHATVDCDMPSGTNSKRFSLQHSPLLNPVLLQGGMYQEGREMARNLGRYCEDQWNALDLLSLLFLSIGLVGRVLDWKSQLGPAFYALGAPLLVSRALFFVQIHPLQGPMIQASGETKRFP